MNTQQVTEEKVWIGLDLGVTSSKVALLSAVPLEIQLGANEQVTIKDQRKYLYTYSNSNYSSFWNYLQALKSKVKGTVKIVTTGGGGMSKLADIAKLFETELQQIVEFQANAKGLEFYRRAKLPLLAQSFHKKKGGQVTVSSKIGTLEEYASSFVFLSLGSGCNWQIFGEGSGGIQRKKHETKGGDDYIIDGTNLGAGFLMGLGKLLTKEKDFSLIAARMKGDQDLKEFYDAFWINLAQFCINIGLTHHQKNVLMSGTLLAYTEDLAPLYSRALKMIHLQEDYDTTVLRLQKFEGFVGTLGALQQALG